VNPAYAGYKEEWFLQSTVRTQWTGMPGAPRTAQLSVDGVTNSESKRVGLGLQMTADKLGPQMNTSLYANYAYRIQLDAEDTKRLSFGLAAGITQFALDGSLLSPTDPDDRLIYNETETKYVPDVRFGLYYSSPRFYLGFSVMDMLAPSILKNDSALNILRRQHYYLIAGTLFDLTESLRVRPGLLFKEDLKGPSCLDLNTMFIFKNRFWFGASYRTGINLWDKKYNESQSLTLLNSFSGIVQFQVSERLRIGYSYDYMMNGLNSAQQGTHEISIGWTIPSKSQRVLSPRFF